MRGGELARLRTALRLAEWGSCDGCGRLYYCPICHAHHEGSHAPDCPIGLAVAGSPELTDEQRREVGVHFDTW